MAGDPGRPVDAGRRLGMRQEVYIRYGREILSGVQEQERQ
jgi:hypothetical protein